MKKTLEFANLIGIVAIACWLTGCSTTTSSSSGSTAQKETLLRQSGFKAKTVTTPKQQQQVAQLTPGVVSAVKYKGKLYYAFPTGKNEVLVGRQGEYNAYKKALQAQAAATQQTQNSDIIRSGETAGPNRVLVQEFDGFGPMEFGPEKTSSEF